MALVIGPDITAAAPSTRSIIVDAKEPLDGDKFKTHKLTLEFDVIDRDEWEQMEARWNELHEKRVKAEKNPEFIMSDDEIQEAREPIHKIAAPYLNAISPMVDHNGQPLELTDQIKEGLIKTPWLQKPITDGFMAVQRGLTLADYKKLLAKNS